MDEVKERAVRQEDEPAKAQERPAVEAEGRELGRRGPDERVDAEDQAH